MKTRAFDYARDGENSSILSTSERDRLLEYGLKSGRLETPDRDALLEDLELARYGDRDARTRLSIWVDENLDALESMRFHVN